MILKIFNQYVPLRKLAFLLLESVFIMGMVILGAYLRFLGDPTNFSNYEYLFFKALLIVVTVQLSLYYFDLYDLKTFRRNFELSIRLLQSLGVSSVLLAILYYLFPILMVGRGIFLMSWGVGSFLNSSIWTFRLAYEVSNGNNQLYHFSNIS